MRLVKTGTASILLIATLNAAALAQPPKGKAPDDPPPSADRPRLEPPNLDQPSNPRPRREPRPDDDGPPPPGKGGARPRSDSPLYPQPGPTPAQAFPGAGGFSGGMRGGGYGGFGGMRSDADFGGGPGRPGPGARMRFGEPVPDDPEMRELIKQDAELEQQSMQMAHRVREATGEERQKLRESLADVVVKHFEVRQKRRELQIKRMEDELKRLRDEIAKRNDARKTIIDNRLREMTGDPRELDF